MPIQNDKINLTSVLADNEPSDFEKKCNDDPANAVDSIVDHLMQSRAFKAIFWSFFLIICFDGLAVITVSGLGGPRWRIYALAFGGGPVLLGWVPFATICALLFSHSLR